MLSVDFCEPMEEVEGLVGGPKMGRAERGGAVVHGEAFSPRAPTREGVRGMVGAGTAGLHRGWGSPRPSPLHVPLVPFCFSQPEVAEETLAGEPGTSSLSARQQSPEGTASAPSSWHGAAAPSPAWGRDRRLLLEPYDLGQLTNNFGNTPQHPASSGIPYLGRREPPPAPPRPAAGPGSPSRSGAASSRPSRLQGTTAAQPVPCPLPSSPAAPSPSRSPPQLRAGTPTALPTCAPHLRGCGQRCPRGSIHGHHAGVEGRHVAGFAGLHGFQAKPAGETCPEGAVSGG